jgi:PAS domain S-box-containing protein
VRSTAGAIEGWSGAGLEALAELTAALAEAESVDHVCRLGVRVVERALGVERASVLLFDDDGVMRFRAWSGLSEAFRAATDGHSPWTVNSVDAVPLVVEDVLLDAELEPLRDTIVADGVRALAFVPLCFERRVVGMYLLYFAEPRGLAEDELRLAGTVADQIALAVKRQRDEDELRSSRDQLEAIFRVVGEGVTVQRPDGELVYANDAAACFLGLETTSELLATPVADIVARFEILDERGEPVAREELPGRRVLAGEPVAERTLVYRDRETGEERASFVRATPVPGRDGEVELVVNVVRDVTAERRRQVWRQLQADASSILAEAFRTEEGYERIAELAVPAVADWCGVSVATPGGSRPVALAHRDDERRRLALELLARYPPRPEVEGGIAWVLRTGRSALVEEMTEEHLASVATDAEHLDLLRRLELRSLMTVPMTARGGTLAAVTFGTRAGGRRFGREYLVHAEELARRAAVALDDAPLFEDQGEREMRLRDAQGRARFVAQASEALAQSFEYDRMLEEVAKLAVPYLADYCFFDLLDEDGTLVRVAAAHREEGEFAERVKPFVPSPANARHPIRRALGSGRPVHVRRVDEAWIRRIAVSDAHASFMREQHVSAVVSVPVAAGGRLLGVLTLMATGRRRYERADVETAQELARRAAVAIDNARLFERVEFQRALLEAQSEAVVDGLLVVRPHGAVLSFNRRFVEIWQIPAETLARGDDAALTESVDRLIDPDAFIQRVRELYAHQEAGRDELRFRDGRTIERYGVPLVGADGSYDGYLWSFRDITERKRIEEALASSLERERDARLRAQLLERNAARLAAAATVSEVATATVEDLEAVGFGIVAVVRHHGEAMEIVASHGLPEEFIDRFHALPVSTDLAVAEAMRTGEAIELATGAEYDRRYPSTTMARARYGVETVAALPLHAADGRVMGALFTASATPHWLDERRRQLVAGVVEQCGLALERAELFEAEHEVALTLQRSLLPRTLPARDSLELAALYRPGSQGLNVGGDWYDALELPDGRIALAVGDVVGHGLDAATVMGELRNAMRPYFLDGLPPHEVLRRLNEVALHSEDRTPGEHTFATAAVALIDVESGRLELASAGHLPPLVLDPDGAASFLETGRGPPIGALDGASYVSAEFELPQGSTLLLYTDGLVERRGDPLDAGLRSLADAAEEGAAVSVGELCASIVRATVGDGGTADDLALLAARLQTAPVFRRRISAQPHQLAPLRGALRAWLERVGADEDVAYDVTLAASEACANAIEHPVGRRSRFVEVEARLLDRGVVLTVRDTGRWRDPGPPRHRGRGLALIEAVMEQVAVERTLDGTEIRMTRALGSEA